MKRAEWDALVSRIAMVRHRGWCLADTHGTPGSTTDYYVGTLTYTCSGPKMGDLALGKAIAKELWGDPED